MRSLPWLTKDTNDDSSDKLSENRLKRKRKAQPVIEIPESTEVETPEIAESPNSDTTTILDADVDRPYDVMIPGYDHDDAYIMVEHDLLEAAKQVTRHLHLKAYQKQAATPVAEEIVRPVTGIERRKGQVEAISEDEDEDVGKDVSMLGELLRRRPSAVHLAATPIRKGKSPSLQRESEQSARTLKSMDNSRHSSSRYDNKVFKERRMEDETLREGTIDVEADDEDEDDEDEDDEDLERPRKVYHPTNSY
jgi:hypothetical protein